MPPDQGEATSWTIPKSRLGFFISNLQINICWKTIFTADTSILQRIFSSYSILFYFLVVLGV
jgi:hypothetical protein